jgi:hypothetical protein
MESETRLADNEGRRVQHTGRHANTPTACHLAEIDSLMSEELSKGRTNMEWTSSTRSGFRYDAKACSWMKLCGGAVKIAFDHQDGDIIAKTNFFRKICRAAEDVVHERFRG